MSDEFYDGIENIDERDRQGLHTHVESLFAYGNFHNNFYGPFAEWLYDKRRTETEILKNVMTLVYISMVDGIALYRAAGVTAQKSTERGMVDVDVNDTKELHNEIIGFPHRNPVLHKAVTADILSQFNIGEGSSLFGDMGEESWEWYARKRSGDGD